MADSTTTAYGLTKPEVGASEDTWGAKINTDLDSLDTVVNAIGGKTAAGTLSFADAAKIATTNTGVDVTGVITTDGLTTSANINFGDSDKAVFGAGSDLQIYHDGSNSFITDVGTGALVIRGANELYLQSTASNNYFVGQAGGAATIYHDNAAKIATTSTGVDVTGVITTDGLTTSANINFGDNDKAIFGAGSDLQIYHDGSNSYVAEGGTGDLILQGAGQLHLKNSDNDEYYVICNDDGAVQIRHDNATKLATTSTGINVTGKATLTSGELAFSGSISDPNGAAYIWRPADNTLAFGTANEERMRILADGNVGIGLTASTAKMHISSPSNARSLKLQNSASNSASQLTFVSDDGTEDAFIRNQSRSTGQDILSLGTGSSERMRILANGNIGIGLAAPTESLHINGGALGLQNGSNATITGKNHPVVYATLGTGSGLFSGYGNLVIQARDTGTASDSNIVLSTGSGSPERIRIESSGFTSFGAFSSSGGSIGVQELAGSKTNVMRRSSTNVTQLNFHLNFHNPNGSVGTISTQNSSTIYATSSDYRLKTDAQPMTGASARVKALNPVNFEWIADGTRVDGFLAHEAQEVVPGCATGIRDGMQDEEYEVTPAVLDAYGSITTAAVMGTRSVPDYQGIDQSKLVPLLTAALQEALTKIEAMETRLTALEG